MRRVPQTHKMSAHSPCQIKNFVNQKTLEKEKLNLSCSALPHAKTRASLKCPVTGSPWKPPCPNSSQTPLNPTPLAILVTPMPFTLL